MSGFDVLTFVSDTVDGMFDDSSGNFVSASVESGILTLEFQDAETGAIQVFNLAEVASG